MRIPSLAIVLLLGVGAAGCNPYMAAVGAVSTTYGVATDLRPASVQASDADIEAKIEAGLLQSPVAGTGSLDVTCRQGIVLLSGVVPKGSDAGRAAEAIARAVPGVQRVNTFFVPARASELRDIELKAKIKEAFVADTTLISGRVDVSVYNGHAVLIGVVENRQQMRQFINDAIAVPGVQSVRSFIQLPRDDGV
ncbi:MAG: BON domain-containing protein [Candidatus Binatia bacterium]